MVSRFSVRQKFLQTLDDVMPADLEVHLATAQHSMTQDTGSVVPAFASKPRALMPGRAVRYAAAVARSRPLRLAW